MVIRICRDCGVSYQGGGSSRCPGCTTERLRDQGEKANQVEGVR